MWVQHRTTICQRLSSDREYRRSSFWRSNHGSQIDLPRDAESLLLPVGRGAMLEPKVADRQRVAAGLCRSGKAADHCIDWRRAGNPCCSIRNWSEDLAATDQQLSLDIMPVWISG